MAVKYNRYLWHSPLMPLAWPSRHRAHEGKLLLLFTLLPPVITKSTLIREGWRCRSKLHCLLNKTFLLITALWILIIGNFYYHQSQPSICHYRSYSLFTLITPQISQIPHSFSTLSLWLSDSHWLCLFITFLSAPPPSNIAWNMNIHSYLT